MDEDGQTQFRQTVDQLSRNDSFDLGFWKEYAYWVLRAFPCIFSIVVYVKHERPNGLLTTIESLGRRDFVIVIFFSLIGPAFFAVGSFIWMWAQDLLERFRR